MIIPKKVEKNFPFCPIYFTLVWKICMINPFLPPTTEFNVRPSENTQGSVYNKFPFNRPQFYAIAIWLTVNRKKPLHLLFHPTVHAPQSINYRQQGKRNIANW
jgi:hypothetical protein